MPADRQIILLIYSLELDKLKNPFPVYCNGSSNENFISVLIMTSLEQERRGGWKHIELKRNHVRHWNPERVIPVLSSVLVAHLR